MKLHRSLLIMFCCFSILVVNPATPVVGQEPPVPVFLPVIQSSAGYDPIPGYLAMIDVNELRDRVYDLVTQYGPRHNSYKQVYVDGACTLGGAIHTNNNLIRSGNYIASMFEAFGFSVAKEIVPGEGGAFNVIAEKPGKLYPNLYLEIGAHLDTQAYTPGGGDNASGVSAMLELARVLVDFPNHYGWRFIAFVGEEYGMTGSRYHTKQALERGEQFKAGLVMDGIGWSENAPLHMNCLWDNSEPESRRIAELFKQARDTYGIDIGWRLCKPSSSNYYSDNVAYWEKGYSAVLSVGGLPYKDPYYHKCGDTWDKVDLQNVLKTAQENLVVLVWLDGEMPALDMVSKQEWWVLPAEAIGH